ncbi:MAG: hypothetical protein AB7E62_01770 [Methanothrix sp.]|jgi:hypothetical protein
MKKLRPNDLKILVKMSDNSGQSATNLDKILKKGKGNILARNLQSMEKANVIFKKDSRKTKNNQNEVPYCIIEDIDNFGYIVGQLAGMNNYTEELKTFLSSKYTDNIIKEFSFLSMYNKLPKEILQSDFKIKASKSLLNLRATKEDYQDFAKELKTAISEFGQDVDRDHAFKDMQLKQELREIDRQLTPKNIDYIGILGNFELAEAIPFYRQNIHESVKEGLENLAEQSIITQGIKEFLILDNYLSPLTSYPVNGSLSLLTTQSFQRIYNEAYLLNGDGLDLLSKRAAAIYEFFPDILFELFRFDPPEKKRRESITKQMILYWNVASTRFDYCYYFAEKCVQEPGNYHITSDGFSYNIIDLEKKEQLLPDSVEKSILWMGSIPRDFDYLGDHMFDDKLMDDPFDSLRPCVTFSDLGIRDDSIPFEEIMAELESRLAELKKEDKRE